MEALLLVQERFGATWYMELSNIFCISGQCECIFTDHFPVQHGVDTTEVTDATIAHIYRI